MPPRSRLEDHCAAKSADELLSARKYVSTGSRSLDTLLGGGVASGELTEVIGDAASGRTSFAMSVCATAVAEGGYAIYVDTTGCISLSRVTRLVDAAFTRRSQHVIDHYVEYPTASQSQSTALATPVDDALGRWQLCRVCAVEELFSGFALRLDEELGRIAEPDLPTVVVVDDIAQLYRLDEHGGAYKRLEVFAGRLAQAAMDYNACIVVVNKARPLNAERPGMIVRRPAAGLSMSFVREVGIPAMGDQWGQLCATRIGLGRTAGHERVARVAKSSRLANQSASFEIGATGVTDARCANASMPREEGS